ncbi:Alpha/Beta hydrolase protein [Clohesyomyces aquaticus]|uniref:Alpha/Beta hydrolase protein n=1 Tax=Clohesyomyces aquaticus TaxID=1231657 RepID=A0A1Y1ZVN9_9PLEO|nr:Alpha/Beta hydrolase protein [Clohesyomyces aquaticus]
MGVLEFLCDRRFHRTVFLPPNPETGRTERYRLSYSDFGDADSDAVVLFCGALMGMRLCYSPLDQLAKDHKVRIIHADRPGIGGSDAVEDIERIEMWLEMIPKLLAHLNVSHVSIASHSAGAIYAMNTILTYPELLHPKNPYAAFFAPWVHPSHSGIAHLRAAELLPAPLIGKFMSVARFVNKNVIPLVGLSTSFIHGIKGSLFQRNTGDTTRAPIPLSPSFVSGMTSRSSSIRSVASGSLNLDNAAVVEELRRLIVSYLFAECTDGISDDCKLVLRKPSSLLWCSRNIVWFDHNDAVPLLSKIIEEERKSGVVDRNWTIDGFHGETDDMVGRKGQEWFDDCWAPNAASPYRREVIPGSDHNYLMDPAFGASAKWLQRVRDAVPEVPESQ